MENYNSGISDGELRELLNGLLADAAENETADQQLIDMESAIVFGTEAFIAAAPAKEKELLANTPRTSRLKLLLFAGSLLLAAWIFFYSYFQPDASQPEKRIAASPVPMKAAAAKAHQPVVSEKTTDRIPPLPRPAQKAGMDVQTKQDEVAEPMTPAPEPGTTGTNDSETPVKNMKPVAGIDSGSASPHKKPAAGSWCRIWTPASFCRLPDSLRLPKSIIYSNGEFDILHCNDLDKDKNLRAVWLTVNVRASGDLRIKSHYANIRLVKSSGEIRTPRGIWGLGRLNSLQQEADYIGDFKAKRFLVEFRERLDMVIFFTDAAPGDKVVIDGFAEVIISK